MAHHRSKLVPTIFVTAVVLLAAGTARAQERLPPIPMDEWSDELKAAAAEGGPVAGPFAVLARSPEVMRLMIDMFLHVSRHNVLDSVLSEIPILIAAREWSQQFEWNAHEGIATRAGVKPEIISAIKEGRRPSDMSEAEAALYDLCIELQRHKGVSDVTYERALNALGGEEQIVEAVAIQGYYSLLAMVMNVAKTPLGQVSRPPLPLLPQR